MENTFRDDARKIKKRKKVAKATLSFALDDEESEEFGSREGSSKEKEDEEDAPPTKRSRSHKNPDVDTSFLPDRDREEAERQERERLRVEWLTKQEQMKKEDIEITYSYWDGSGHRKSVVVGILLLSSNMLLTSTMVVQKRRRRCNLPRKMSTTISRATRH
jgi:protein FAM50